jgi:hypothetical protein
MIELFGAVKTLEWQPLLERAAEAQRVSRLLQIEARGLRGHAEGPGNDEMIERRPVESVAEALGQD